MRTDYSKKVQNESIFWIMSAGELHLSAKIIWEAYNSNIPQFENYSQKMGIHLQSALPRTFAMNAGLSIELGIKACILQRYSTLSQEHYIHNLIKLKEYAGIILDERQQKQLDILTEFISWAGRYPIGKAVNSFDVLMDKLESIGIDAPWESHTLPIIWDEYNKIWNKIIYHFQGIGGGGSISETGNWISDFKGGLIWKVVKESQIENSSTFQDYEANLTVAEAFILAEKLNSERFAINGMYMESYFTAEM
ncbi:MAG: hypothetical protein A2X86_00455 [Bdellovibrionales bacterium GWA2_49_15]|nr:MAG: hypothetical protein A2X86_00455 [Bdellovibrionales bacterium GWA2_49_15]HAZ13263.1 hypothetical protein [Bdellovibrionales bacterium]